MPFRRIPDSLAAALIGLATLLLYVRTLLPHLGGTEDTAKFQYLGAVLGTAHSPGYPTYILISHLFSRLPFATLAYRINFMSACFGATAAALCYLSARRLECSRPIAAIAAVSLALGRAFWGNSVIAEVYTLNVALWSAAVLFFLRWLQSTRDRDLFVATAFVAVGLGNHLTILGLFPAALVLLLLSRRRWYRPRIVVTCAVILAAGIAQYGFIWLRTMQRGTYLEARASNLAELIDVVTARRFAGGMFRYGPGELLTERLPFLWSIVRLEVGIVAVAAAAIGVLWLARKRPAQAGLLAVSSLAVTALTLNVDADAGGFLLPVFAMLWLAAAVGLDVICGAVVRRSGRLGTVVAVGLIAMLPVVQVRANFAANDQSHRDYESRYFEALFRELPDRSALLINEYIAEQMFRYVMISGDYSRHGEPLLLESPVPDRVHRLIDEGVSVFAMPYAVEGLRGRGFTLSPVRLHDQPLGSYLRDVAAGKIVAVASSGLDLTNALSAGLDGEVVRGGGMTPASVFLGVRNPATQPALRPGGDSVELSAPAGRRVGAARITLPVDVRLAANRRSASVTFGRNEVTAERGVAVAVFDAGGETVDQQTFTPEHGFRSELPVGGMPLVQVTSTPCGLVGDNGWHDLSDVTSDAIVDTRLDNHAPFDSSLLYYVGSPRPLDADLRNVHAGCQGARPCPTIASPTVSAQHFARDSPDDVARLRGLLAADGLTSPEALLASPYVSRVEVSANDQGQFVVFELRFSGAPRVAFVRARTDSREPERVSVCKVPAPRIQWDDAHVSRSIPLTGDLSVTFGSGWHAAERLGAGAFRWTSGPGAMLLVPLAKAEAIAVRITAGGLDLNPPATVEVVVNGKATSAQPLAVLPREYRWAVPASAWRAGMNEVEVRVSRVERPSAVGQGGDDRLLGAKVSAIVLERLDSSATGDSSAAR